MTPIFSLAVLAAYFDLALSFQVPTLEELKEAKNTFTNHELKEFASDLYEEILRLQAANFVNARDSSSTLLQQYCSVTGQWHWYLAMLACIMVQLFCLLVTWMVNYSRRKEEEARRRHQDIVSKKAALP